jgi:hypothetical protein
MPKGLLESLVDKLFLPEVANPKMWQRGKLKWVDNQQRYVLQTASLSCSLLIQQRLDFEVFLRYGYGIRREGMNFQIGG